MRNSDKLARTRYINNLTNYLDRKLLLFTVALGFNFRSAEPANYPNKAD
jgi:hypothetical protein